MWVPQTLLQSKGFVGCRQSHLTLHRWNFSCCRYLPEQLKDQAHRLVGDETPPELEAEGSYFLKRISKGWWFMMILQTCASYVRCYIYIYICSSDRGEHPDQIQYLIIYLLPCFGDPHETFTALWLSLTTNPWRPVMRPFGGLSCFWVNMVNHVLQAWQGTFAICVWEKLFANPSQS